MNFGAFLARPSSADIFAQADLVIVFGSELSEGDLWRKKLGQDCPLIRVDVDPCVLAQAPRATAMLRGDAIGIISELNTLLPENGSTAWTPNEVAAARTCWRAEVDAERPGIVPVCDALRDCLPKGTMIYSDMTQFAYTAKEIWDMARCRPLASSDRFWHPWLCHARRHRWGCCASGQADNGDHRRLRLPLHNAGTGRCR